MQGKHRPAEPGAEFVTALLPHRLLEALDRYISEEAPGKTRSDALRDACREWAIARGFTDKTEG